MRLFLSRRRASGASVQRCLSLRVAVCPTNSRYRYAREAALAVGRLLRLGATADDLQAVARYAFAHGIGEAIEIAEGNTGQLPYLDATGDFREIASELWFCINETTSDDLAN